MASGRGISINFVANVRDFLRGSRDTEEALDDVADALDDVARDGDKSTEKLERSFRDLTREANRSTDKIADDARKDFKRAEGAVEGFKDEAKQNFAETASSFDGSIESMADMVQSTFGGLATSIAGPLGIAFAGIGLAGGAALSGIIERSEEMKERVSENFRQMVENGKAELTELQFQERLADILAEDLVELEKASQLTGIPVANLAEALARGGDSAQRMADRVWEMRDGFNVMSPEFNQIEHLAFRFSAAADATAEAERAMEVYGDVTNRVADQQGKRLEGLADKFDNLPRNITTTVDLDTRALERELAQPRKLRVAVEGFVRGGRRVF